MRRKEILEMAPPVVSGLLGAVVFGSFLFVEPAASFDMYTELIIALSVFMMLGSFVWMDEIVDKSRLRDEMEEEHE